MGGPSPTGRSAAPYLVAALAIVLVIGGSWLLSEPSVDPELVDAARSEMADQDARAARRQEDAEPIAPTPVEVVSTAVPGDAGRTIHAGDSWSVTAPAAWSRQSEEEALTLQGPSGEWAGVDIESFTGELDRHVERSIAEGEGGADGGAAVRAEIVGKRAITFLGRSGYDAEVRLVRAGTTLHFLSRWVAIDSRRVLVAHCGRMAGPLDAVRAECDAMLASLIVTE